jgi:hypothetical protein
LTVPFIIVTVHILLFNNYQFLNFQKSQSNIQYVVDCIYLCCNNSNLLQCVYILLLVWPCSRTWQLCYYTCTIKWWQINGWFRFMVFNATFNNISVISWQSVLLLEDSGVPGENHWSVASHWKTSSLNVVSSTPRHEWGWNSQL